MSQIIKFGGLDVALRSDNTALFSMKLENGIFEEIGNKVWPHIDYNQIGEDLLKIQRHEKFNAIGFDRLGSGEVVKMFNREIPLVPIVSSAPAKQDMIGLVKGLFNKKKLIIHTPRLYQEILEQERIISDAGNILYQHPQGFHDDRFWSMCLAVKVASRYIHGMPKSMIAFSQKPKTERDIEKDIEKTMRDI